jgi:hypothetical protein
MELDLQQGPAQKAGDILVFLIRKETKCSECGQELGSGRTVLANTGIIGFLIYCFAFPKPVWCLPRQGVYGGYKTCIFWPVLSFQSDFI